jgi:hypothetical protein
VLRRLVLSRIDTYLSKSDGHSSILEGICPPHLKEIPRPVGTTEEYLHKITGQYSANMKKFEILPHFP